MKNRQTPLKRAFVVEYKANRRRAKADVKSIWGDTDLKGLTQAVIDDGADTAGLRMPIASFQPTALVPVVGAGPNGDAPPAPVASDDNGDDLPIAPIEVVASVPPDVAEPMPQRKPRRQPAAPRIGKRPASREEPVRPALLSPEAAQPDELAALETENNRLKLLLVGRLREENRRLAEMLQRY